MALHVRILAGRLDRAAGSHVYHNQLARRLAARGHRVSVVCLASEPEVASCAEITEIAPRRYDQSRFLWRVATVCRYLECARALRAANLAPPDMVIGGEHLFLKAHFHRFPRTPWIYLPHALSVSEEIRHCHFPPVLHSTSLLLYRHLQRWALQRSSCTMRFTVSASEFLDRAYGSRFGSRFVVNPMGVDIPQMHSRPGGSAVPRLLAVGRLTHVKGFDIALNSLAQLKHLPWRLNIMGDGELRTQLERFAVAAGIGDRVTFLGHRGDPSPWYTQSDLLLFPSRSESLGLVALEAMSFGVPCLAFRADDERFVNVNEEIIDHGRTGLLARNEVDFRDTLGTMLQSVESLARLGGAARNEVAEKYSWNRHLLRYETLFEQLSRG